MNIHHNTHNNNHDQTEEKQIMNILVGNKQQQEETAITYSLAVVEQGRFSAKVQAKPEIKQPLLSVDDAEELTHQIYKTFDIYVKSAFIDPHDENAFKLLKMLKNNEKVEFIYNPDEDGLFNDFFPDILSDKLEQGRFSYAEDYNSDYVQAHLLAIKAERFEYGEDDVDTDKTSYISPETVKEAFDVRYYGGFVLEKQEDNEYQGLLYERQNLELELDRLVQKYPKFTTTLMLSIYFSESVIDIMQVLIPDFNINFHRIFDDIDWLYNRAHKTETVVDLIKSNAIDVSAWLSDNKDGRTASLNITGFLAELRDNYKKWVQQEKDYYK